MKLRYITLYLALAAFLGLYGAMRYLAEGDPPSVKQRAAVDNSTRETNPESPDKASKPARKEWVPAPGPEILERGSATSSLDTAALLIKRLGPPDRDDSTAYDNPRPPIVTRFIEYRSQGVKIIFTPKAKYGEAPPYSAWKAIGFIDLRKKKALTPEAAYARLGL